MSTLLRDEQGRLLAVHNFEEVTVEKAKEYIAELHEDIEILQNWVNEQEAKNGQDQNNPPAPEKGQPSQPANGASDSANPPEASNQGQDQVTPPADPNAAPAPDASAVTDPNQPAGEAPATPLAPTDQPQTPPADASNPEASPEQPPLT